MFFLFALTASAGYALQNVLMAGVYRRIDGLTAVMLRGFALGITMLPFLLFAPCTPIELSRAYPLIAGAAFVTVFGNWAGALSYKHLSIGIATGLNMSFAAVMSALFGAMILGDAMSLAQALWVVLILAGVVALGASRTGSNGLPHYSMTKGAAASVSFGCALGLGYALVAGAARSVNPLWTGYLWELTIGVWALILTAGRSAVSGSKVLPKNWRCDFRTIVYYSVPSAVGTGCYSLAVASGPVGLVAAVLSTSMVFSSVLAFFLKDEGLRPLQWFWICFVTLMVIGLKVFA